MKRLICGQRGIAMEVYRACYQSPIGILGVTGNDYGICSIEFMDARNGQFENTDSDHPVLMQCLSELDKYFKGSGKCFTVKLYLQGTEFQKRVWNQLCKIPFGETRTYRELAVAVGKEEAVRAVGNANGKNRINIIVPCHRVIGSDGKLTGYGGGLWRKDWLLKHEALYNAVGNC